MVIYCERLKNYYEVSPWIYLTHRKWTNVSPVSAPPEDQSPLPAIVELSLKLAGECDPELFLQALSHVARQMIPARYASVGVLDKDWQTTQCFFSGMDTASTMPSSSVAQRDLLAKKLVECGALRLGKAASESVGVSLLPECHLESVLAVPLSDSQRFEGWLLLANRLHADEFSDHDEHLAMALAGQVSLAYERVEEQRRASDAEDESRDVLEALFESAPDAIVVVNEQGRIVRVNAETLRLFGYTRAELVGEFVEILVPERFRAAHPTCRQEYFAHPHRREMDEGLELFGRRRDATEFPVDITLSPLSTKGGKQTLGVIRDATTRKNNEERIQQLHRSLEKHVERLQAANEELERFSYSVSHDLRAPLRQVDGFARILWERMGPQSDPGTIHYLHRIQDAATHMGCLIEGMLDLAKLGRQALRVQPINLNSLASLVIEELKVDAPDRRIEWILDPLPTIRCDRVLMRAVFYNLLSNAVKFTAKRESATIRVGHRLESGETVIFVADNGVGFNMKYADKLFGIFQRLHRSDDYPGTGVGLATVKRIIEKHGGRIWAEAEPDSRATFHFTLLPPDLPKAEGSEQETEVLL